MSYKENKLIAQFMGYKVHTHRGCPFLYKYILQGQLEYDLRELEYDSSWDWLMEVIEKIEHLDTGYEVCIIDKECEIGTMGYQYTRVALGKANTKIEAVYIAIIQFIKWYNDKSK